MFHDKSNDSEAVTKQAAIYCSYAYSTTCSPNLHDYSTTLRFIHTHRKHTYTMNTPKTCTMTANNSTVFVNNSTLV